MKATKAGTYPLPTLFKGKEPLQYRVVSKILIIAPLVTIYCYKVLVLHTVLSQVKLFARNLLVNLKSG
jgi:hypothetical protein